MARDRYDGVHYFDRRCLHGGHRLLGLDSNAKTVRSGRYSSDATEQ